MHEYFLCMRIMVVHFTGKHFHCHIKVNALDVGLLMRVTFIFTSNNSSVIFSLI